MKKRTEPGVPPKLWMLWSDKRANCTSEPIGWVRDADGLCCFTSLSDAKQVAKRYLAEYRLPCRPVQVKGASNARTK